MDVISLGLLNKYVYMGVIVEKDWMGLKVVRGIDLQAMLINKRPPNIYFNLIKILLTSYSFCEINFIH